MNKIVTAPVAKAATVTAPAIVPTALATVVAPTVAPTAVEPKKIDMSKQSIKDAIIKGRALIKEGKSKADAAMVIFEALKAEEKEVVVAAFVQGATLTEKGAVTYFYNCRRKSKKLTAKPT
jgi:transcriptional/translational regulatory protein YebC/TACO1